jgi:alkylation response protein AidB-like acyl-CoA dehydrogenase
MDFRLTDDQHVLRRSIRDFAETEIGPHVMAWDEVQAFPDTLVAKMAAVGLLGIQFPESLGGSAMSAVDYCICIEELARVCPAVALSVAAHNGLCAAHLAMFGTDAQQARFLVPLAKGEMLGAWGLTEPTAGSDAAGTRTMAVRDGDGWVINGAKTFITHGRIGGVMVAMAVTDRSRGNRGISAFIVPRGTDGMRAGKKENKLGMRASDTSEVIFTDCRVPADSLLGQDGQGFVNAMQVLDAGRTGIAALSVGLAQGAFEAAVTYAKARRQFGQPIANFQATQFKLADLATRIDAGRLLTYRAAHMKDRGLRTTRESAEAKLFTSEVAVRAAEECVQIHGGYGFVKDYPAEKYFVIARQLLA